MILFWDKKPTLERTDARKYKEAQERSDADFPSNLQSEGPKPPVGEDPTGSPALPFDSSASDSINSPLDQFEIIPLIDMKIGDLGPLFIVLALTGPELGVAISQAHVSTISICIYLNDATNLHQTG
ncbi:ATP synthase subunit a, partial [Mucuna pruriens]